MSELLPWKSYNPKVNGSAFNAGDRISGKRNEVWREQLVAPSAGADENPIVFNAYGSGNLPRISGAVLPTWVVEGGNYYYVEIAGNETRGGVWNSGVRMTLAASKVALNTITEYWIDVAADPDRLYVWDDSGVPTTVEYSSLDNVVSITDLSYVTFQYLDVFGSTGNAMLVDGAGAQVFGITVEQCEVHGFYDYGIHNPANFLADLTIRRNAIYDATRAGDPGGGIRTGRGNVVLIEYNTIYGVDHGILLRRCENSGIVRYNFIYDTWDDSIFAEDTCEIYYNVCWNAEDDGIELGADADGSEIYNNLCGEASDAGIALSANCINCTVRNNIVYNCMRQDGENDQLRDMYVATGTGHDIDNNLYYSDGTFLWYWEAEQATFAAWKAASGQDADSPTMSNPLFVDESARNFQLESASPAIDAGVDVGLNQDLIGTVIPQGSAPDIGPYEFTPSIIISHGPNAATLIFLENLPDIDEFWRGYFADLEAVSNALSKVSED